MELKDAFDLVDNAIDQIKISGILTEEEVRKLSETQYRIRNELPVFTSVPKVQEKL